MEFAERKVADIAAKAMNNYMIFGRQLDVHIMEEAHQNTFKHGNRDWKFTPTRQIFRSKKNAEQEGRTPEQRKARVQGLLQKEKERRDRLKELEIDYQFPGYRGIVDDFKAKNTKPEKKAPATEKKTTKSASKDKKKSKK